MPCQSAILFLWYDFYKIWPWKSKVKVMAEVKVESHKVGVTSYRLTPVSFRVNRPFHSWDPAFSKFDLENPRSRSNDQNGAQLPQIWPILLNEINTKVRKINRLWPKSNQFWRWSGYFRMNFQAMSLLHFEGNAQKPFRMDEWEGSWLVGHLSNGRSDGRRNGHPHPHPKIIPPAP